MIVIYLYSGYPLGGMHMRAMYSVNVMLLVSLSIKPKTFEGIKPKGLIILGSYTIFQGSNSQNEKSASDFSTYDPI